jgi:bifunctional UDP-N-acetylglucosamine pyrophosphorylase / glucosamine-1-phosphate N-acetyltransferase
MSNGSEVIAIVLAAGQGKRMKSNRAKVLHELAGRPLVTYPVEAALRAGASRAVVVVGRDSEKVQEAVKNRFGDRVLVALQPEQRGTGDAARCGVAALSDYEGWLLILYGDCPLISSRALRELVDHAAAQSGPLGMLICNLTNPAGYGRMIRDERGKVVSIREDKDCNNIERKITEVNPGVYAIKAPFFREAITQMTDANAQRELYLTDLVSQAARAGGVAELMWDAAELQGINDRAELAECEQKLRRQIARDHALAGVTIRDPNTAYIDRDVVIENDASIENQVTLRGQCVIGAGAYIDVGCVLTDVVVHRGARLLPYTVARKSEIGENARVGPFSHIREDSHLGPETHVGNFVETKKTEMAQGAKANHLAYLGDGKIGERVNVGAGTIFCNYDGFLRHLTVLEDDCFIGSDSQLIAPIKVGRGAYVATGSTLTDDVPADTLAIGRAKQENKLGLAPKLRASLQARKDALTKK